MASVALAALTRQFKNESDSCTARETHLQVLALGQMELEQVQVQGLALGLLEALLALLVVVGTRLHVAKTNSNSGKSCIAKTVSFLRH